MSFATEALEKIEAVLLGKMDNDVQNYSIKGRQHATKSATTVGLLL